MSPTGELWKTGTEMCFGSGLVLTLERGKLRIRMVENGRRFYCLGSGSAIPSWRIPRLMIDYEAYVGQETLWHTDYPTVISIWC